MFVFCLVLFCLGFFYVLVYRQQVKKSVFDGFEKSRLSYYELLPKDNDRTLNNKEGLNNPLTISPVLCFITFLSMITFADAGCVVLTWGLQLFGDVWMYIAYCFPDCQLLRHWVHTTGEKMFHHYTGVR